MEPSCKILIVEDEAIVLDGIRRMLHNFDSRIAEVTGADSAEAALERIRKDCPHIIVLDIVLPNKSGLQLLDELRQTTIKRRPKVVVVSSYNEFSYAQRSLRYGAVDYILKPFVKEDFLDKMKNLLDLVAEEEQAESSLQSQLQAAKEGTKKLIDRDLYSFFLNRTHLEEHIYHRLQIWELAWLAKSEYRLVSVGAKGRQHETERSKHDRDRAIESHLEQCLASFDRAHALKISPFHWAVIIAAEQADQLLRTLRNRFPSDFKPDLIFGVSDPMSAFHSLSEAYKQAGVALRKALADNKSIVAFADIAYMDETTEKHAPIRIEQLIVNNELSELPGLVDRTLNGLVLFNDSDPEAPARQVLDWIRSIHTAILKDCGVNITQIPLSLWEKLDNCDTLDAMKRTVTAYFNDLARQLASRAELKNAVVERAKTIIFESRNGNISLQELSDKLQLSPVWVSQLFKKETGRNFSEFITDVKINFAKEMLRNSHLKIYEISLEVGFQNIQHFSEVFKKRTGLTPKEFRYGKVN